MIDSALATATQGIAERFRTAAIDFQLGGSLMLALSGFEIAVGDVDVVVGEDAHDQVVAALAGIPVTAPPGKAQWGTGFLLRASWPVDRRGVGVDIMGGLALLIDGQMVSFPPIADRNVDLQGTSIPLAPLRHWYHLYRVHNPARASLIAGRLSDDEIMQGAAELSIATTFSPTLIVRIGSGSH